MWDTIYTYYHCNWDLVLYFLYTFVAMDDIHAFHLYYR